MAKFTFKRNDGGAWHNDTHTIKYKRKPCGIIYEIEPFGGKCEVRLQVIKDDINEDGNPNCEWKWIRFKKKFDSVQEAKDSLNANIEGIMEKFNLYFQD